jgi:hypothetical protein
MNDPLGRAGEGAEPTRGQGASGTMVMAVVAGEPALDSPVHNAELGATALLDSEPAAARGASPTLHDLAPVEPPTGLPTTTAPLADQGADAPAHDAPRPTLVDVAAVSPAPPRRRGAVLVAAFVTVALALAGGSVALFWFVFRYTPTAHLHVPRNAAFVLRAELAELALFGPVRNELQRARSDEASAKRRAEIEAATGVSVTDLREALVATPDGVSWVVLLGGRIARGRVVTGLAKVLNQQEQGKFAITEGEPALLTGKGVVVGQADDGTIVVGSNESIVRAALEPSTEPVDGLRLPPNRALGFAVSSLGLEGAVGKALFVPGITVLRRVARADGDLSLGDKPTLEVRLHVASGEDPMAVGRDVESVLASARLMSMMMPDTGGARTALQQAKLKVEGRQVHIAAPWAPADIERAIELLRGPPPSPASSR